MFVRLTMPGNANALLDPRVIYVAAERIHTISPRHIRVDPTKAARGPEDWKVEGSFVDTNGGEDSGFAVIETAEDILRCIREVREPYNDDFISVLPPVPSATEFPEVFSEDMGAAPIDGRFCMGRDAKGRETPMVWWRNWPGWREVSEMEVMGAPFAAVAWRPLTHAEACGIEIPF